MRQSDLFRDDFDEADLLSENFTLSTVTDRLSLLRYLSDWHTEITSEILDHRRQINRLEFRASMHPELQSQIDPLYKGLARLEALLGDIDRKREELNSAKRQEESEQPDGLEQSEEPEVIEGEIVPSDPSDPSEKGLTRVKHFARDFFLADLVDYSIKDDHASMEGPIFSLSTKKDLRVWEWKSADGKKHLQVVPSVLGRATMHDKDVLIFVISQFTEALNRGREDASNRTARFTVHDFLVTTNRGTSGDDYKRLEQALDRLKGTMIKTNIQTGGKPTKEGFGIIDKWRIVERSATDARMIAVEVTLSEWFHNAVSAYEVLTIHSDYFRLRKPLARRMYELARKHCGRQASWSIGLEKLYEKSGSTGTIYEFHNAIKSIASENSLPEYVIEIAKASKLSDVKVSFGTRNAQKQIAAAVRARTK